MISTQLLLVAITVYMITYVLYKNNILAKKNKLLSNQMQNVITKKQSYYPATPKPKPLPAKKTKKVHDLGYAVSLWGTLEKGKEEDFWKTYENEINSSRKYTNSNNYQNSKTNLV